MNKKNVLALIASLSVSMSAAAESELSGHWQIENNTQASEVTTDAIEGVVEDMNFFVRAIARSRLEAETQVCEQWQLDRAEQTFQWQCAGGQQWTVNTEQDTQLKGDDGRDIQASFIQRGTSVSVTLRSERGVRTYQWLLQEDDGMLYRSILESEKLPRPLDFSIHYQKVNP